MIILGLIWNLTDTDILSACPKLFFFSSLDNGRLTVFEGIEIPSLVGLPPSKFSIFAVEICHAKSIHKMEGVYGKKQLIIGM